MRWSARWTATSASCARNWRNSASRVCRPACAASATSCGASIEAGRPEPPDRAVDGGDGVRRDAAGGRDGLCVLLPGLHVLARLLQLRHALGLDTDRTGVGVAE